jgi:hypothetical protein
VSTGKKYLMALDPGKATGFVVLDITGFPETEPIVVIAEEPDQFNTCLKIHTILGSGDDVEVVMEDFKVNSGTAKKSLERMFSSEIIGVARYFCELYDHKFTLQTPAAAKSFVDNDRIRALGLWVKGGEGHHKDAMRHAILYLVKHYEWKPEGLLG